MTFIKTATKRSMTPRPNVRLDKSFSTCCTWKVHIDGKRKKSFFEKKTESIIIEIKISFGLFDNNIKIIQKIIVHVSFFSLNDHNLIVLSR